MLDKNGVATKEQVMSVFPDKKFLDKPKCIIECYEEIPCNPCETSCAFKAIKIGENINNRPVYNPSLCTGCTICIAKCPGLAISMVQLKDNNAIFKIPYEFSPLPKVNDIYYGVNRSGVVICDAQIMEVRQIKGNKTNIVTVKVDEDYLYDFVTIRRKYE